MLTEDAKIELWMLINMYILQKQQRAMFHHGNSSKDNNLAVTTAQYNLKTFIEQL